MKTDVFDPDHHQFHDFHMDLDISLESRDSQVLAEQRWENMNYLCFGYLGYHNIEHLGLGLSASVLC